VSKDEAAAPDALWQMTNAYQTSQAIHVAATLGITDLLSDGLVHVSHLLVFLCYEHILFLRGRAHITQTAYFWNLWVKR
jgi:hypothetical protein